MVQRLARLAACLLALAPVAAGCGGGGGATVRVAGTAVDEAAGVLRVGTTVVELGSDDIGRLASQAEVSDDVVTSVAPQLHTQSTWTRFVRGVRTVEQTTDGEVRDVALRVGCDALKGEIRSEADVYNALADQLEGLSEHELESVYWATLDLWDDLYAAGTSQDPQARASVAIACYTIDQLG